MEDSYEQRIQTKTNTDCRIWIYKFPYWKFCQRKTVYWKMETILQSWAKLLFLPSGNTCLPNWRSTSGQWFHAVQLQLLYCWISTCSRCFIRKTHLRLDLPIWVNTGVNLQNSFTKIQTTQNFYLF